MPLMMEEKIELPWKIIWFRTSSSSHPTTFENAILYQFNQYFPLLVEGNFIVQYQFSTNNKTDHFCFATVLKTQGLHFFDHLEIKIIFFLLFEYKKIKSVTSVHKKEKKKIFFSHIWSGPTQISHLLKQNCAFFFFAEKKVKLTIKFNKFWMIFFVGTTLSCKICRFLS